ncbi:MAG: IclR family transcriptional regulator [Spirochaetia bacterium]
MPSVQKIHDILELLRKNFRTGLTNKEISEALAIPTSTCYRILAALKKFDYITKRDTDLRYFLGFAHLRFAESVVEGMDEAAVCLPYLEDLHGRTEETTFFARWTGTSCVAVEVCGAIDTRISVGRGEVMPLHCSATGRCVLAFLPPKEQERLIRDIDLKAYTSRTITDPQELRAKLVEIRSTGVSALFQEFNKGINAMATPIFGPQGRVLGALALVGSSADLDAQQLDEYAKYFLDASTEVTRRLAGLFPDWIAARAAS